MTTDMDRKVLAAIKAHIEDHGWPPSLAEIGGRVGLKSRSSVHRRVQHLAAGGFLVVGPNPRQIRVIR